MDRALPVPEQITKELDLICKEIRCYEPVFSSKGGCAIVYEGTLADGIKVAIKTDYDQHDESTKMVRNI